MVYYAAIAVAAVLVGIDQFTKYLVYSNMELHQSIPVIAFGDTHVINITYERNSGAAFSILEGKQIFLIIVTALVIAGMLFFLLTKRIKKPRYVWAVSLVIAGGAGNLVDRVANASVVDFIDVKIINFAVFNFADICAVAGAACLLLFVLLDEIAEHKKKKAGADANHEAITHHETADEQK